MQTFYPIKIREGSIRDFNRLSAKRRALYDMLEIGGLIIAMSILSIIANLWQVQP